MKDFCTSSNRLRVIQSLKSPPCNQEVDFFPNIWTHFCVIYQKHAAENINLKWNQLQ